MLSNLCFKKFHFKSLKVNEHDAAQEKRPNMQSKNARVNKRSKSSNFTRVVQKQVLLLQLEVCKF